MVRFSYLAAPLALDAACSVLDMAIRGWRLLGLLVACQARSNDPRGTVVDIPLPLCSVWRGLVSSGADG